jgi:hypothetical protein
MSFSALPRELRDEIYSYLLPPCAEVRFPYRAEIRFTKIIHKPDFALSFLARHLPRGIFLNHQILEEATIVVFSRSKVVVDNTVLSAVGWIFDLIGEDVAWKNVKELKFVSSQPCYAYGHEATSSTTPPKCVHDIAIRCPKLSKLSITLAPDALITSTNAVPMHGAPRYRRPSATVLSPDERFNLTGIVENKNLAQVHVCVSTLQMESFEPYDWKKMLDESTAALRDVVKYQGKSLEVSIRVMQLWGFPAGSTHPLA